MSARETYQRLLDEPSDMQGHLATLYGWVVRLRPEWVIELGVRSGVSTAAFLAGLERNRKGKLWSCDIEDIRREIRDHPRWQFAVGDDLKPEDLDPPPPSRCQLLFIDTSHKRKQTRRELEIYGERVEPGGVVLAHDVDERGCGAAVRGWSLAMENGDKATRCYGLGATLIR